MEADKIDELHQQIEEINGIREILEGITKTKNNNQKWKIAKK